MCLNHCWVLYFSEKDRSYLMEKYMKLGQSYKQDGITLGEIKKFQKTGGNKNSIYYNWVLKGFKSST